MLTPPRSAFHRRFFAVLQLVFFSTAKIPIKPKVLKLMWGHATGDALASPEIRCEVSSIEVKASMMETALANHCWPACSPLADWRAGRPNCIRPSNDRTEMVLDEFVEFIGITGCGRGSVCLFAAFRCVSTVLVVFSLLFVCLTTAVAVVGCPSARSRSIGLSRGISSPSAARHSA